MRRHGPSVIKDLFGLRSSDNNMKVLFKKLIFLNILSMVKGLIKFHYALEQNDTFKLNYIKD
jgi:hypothetical protein